MCILLSLSFPFDAEIQVLTQFVIMSITVLFNDSDQISNYYKTKNVPEKIYFGYFLKNMSSSSFHDCLPIRILNFDICSNIKNNTKI